MADKEKKAAQGSKVEKAATDESKAAAKVTKAAKGAGKKSDKPNFFVRAGKGTKEFFRHFRGESKKIVWPDAKTVLKSTGIVILVVAVAAVIIFGIDRGLGAGVTGLKSLANRGETTTTSAVAEDDHDHDHDAEEASTTGADSSKESTTKADSSEKETTAAKTTESKESSTAAE